MAEKRFGSNYEVIETNAYFAELNKHYIDEIK